MNSARSIQKFLQLTLSASALAVLVACGGGGGGNSTSGSTGVSLSGVASKGLIQFGVVKAYGVSSAGAIDRSRVLAQTETDVNGAYELTGLPTGVSVVVEITAGTATKIVDEASDLAIDPPAGFALRAATVLESGTTVSDRNLQITPFSEMAVAAAQGKEGGLSATNVGNANADVRALVGFDVLTEKPEFADGGETPTNRAALLLAAVSQMAASGSLGCDDATQTERVKCVVDQMASRGADDADLADALNNAKSDAEEEEAYAGDDAPPVAAVEAPSNLSADQISGVAAAKALIASLRNNAPIIEGSNPESLESRVNAVDAAFSSAIEPMGETQQALLETITVATQVLAEDTGDFSNEIGFGVNLGLGIAECVVLTSTPTSLEPSAFNLASNWDQARSVACYVQATEAHRALHLVTVSKSSTTDTSYDINTLVMNDADEVTKGAMSGSGRILATATHTVVNDALNSLSLVGDLAPKINTDGSLTSGYDRMGVNLVLSPSTGGNPTTLNLRGEFSAKNSSGTATTTVGLREGSYIRANLNTAGQPGSGVANNTASAGRFDMIYRLNSGESVNGVLLVSDFKTDTSGEDVPSKASFEGTITGASGASLFQGKLTAEVSNITQVNTNQNESAGNFFKKTLTLQGKLGATASKPEASVNLTLVSTQTFGSYALTGSYVSGANTVNLSVVYSDNNNAADDTATFESTTGVKVVLNDVDTQFDITRNGVLIGEIDRTKRTVFYKDKTSESF